MTQLLNDFLSGSAAWGVLLTLAAFALGTLINKVTGKAIFNPLLLGSIFVIIFLSVCNIPYADYKASAAPVNYLLLPATVALAIPLYEKIDLLKENAAAIIAGISVGTLVSLGSALALALAHTGHAFTFFSPFLGWLGVFLTGSDTSSNALFAALQATAAQQIGVSDLLLVAANTTGGVTGKMISPQSIAIACAAVGLVGKESDLFRFTVKHSLIFTCIVGVITTLQAYVLTWMIP